MKKYKCHKVVSAKPMTRHEFNELKGKPFDPLGGEGYLVEYEDGYQSWSPKKAFEDGYTLIKADPLILEQLAGRMFDAYCCAVGGKSFNGDKLPTWEEMIHDGTKALQVAAWLVAAKESKA